MSKNTKTKKGGKNMGVKEKRLTEQFTAKSEDGRQFDLLVYTDILDVGTSQNPNAS